MKCVGSSVQIVRQVAEILFSLTGHKPCSQTNTSKPCSENEVAKQIFQIIAPETMFRLNWWIQGDISNCSTDKDVYVTIYFKLFHRPQRTELRGQLISGPVYPSIGHLCRRWHPINSFPWSTYNSPIVLNTNILEPL